LWCIQSLGLAEITSHDEEGIMTIIGPTLDGIHERFVGNKLFSQQDVAADILFIECDLCCSSKVSRRKRRNEV
jgi:hypothetical protein